MKQEQNECCRLYISDAADEEDSVDLGGRCITKKKKKKESVDVGGLLKIKKKKQTSKSE